ncbi:zinc metalloprotease HtpX [Salinarimonas rosea]|uniref:zinc metalloprotease HtpX n=1 Tax=Salinarimonas rosea TaxID=552063 RepID=UPI0003F616CB|nr:zinc metalloprotease HtpX [Salinarimonas rosea]
MAPTLRHKLRNLAHAAVLVAAMAAITWAATSALWGSDGGAAALLVLLASLAFAPSVPKRLVLSAHGARLLTSREFPMGVAALRELAVRAELPAVPQLWYVPSRLPNAFALGSPRDSAIVVSEGLLRLLDARELAGVLAHEVSHIANRDLWLMALADVMARLVGLSVAIGQLIVLFGLPLLMMGVVLVPWTTVLVLLLAPTVMSLLQLALSRAREFDADLGAAELTGDPAGLARALLKLERRVGRWWEDILLQGRRIPEPSLLRTHPPTEERVARLKELASGRSRGWHPHRRPPAFGSGGWA